MTTSSNYESLCRTYLATLESEFRARLNAGQSDNELALRPLVDLFLGQSVNSIDPNVAKTMEPPTIEGNKPDWRFTDSKTFGLYGYGEHKSLALSASFNIDPHAKQLSRYLEMGPLFATDGLEFVFFDSSGNEERVSLIDRQHIDDGVPWSQLPINANLYTKLQEFVDSPQLRSWSEEDLISEVGRQAQVGAQLVGDLLDAGIGGGQNQSENDLIKDLISLQTIVRRHHDPTLSSSEACASFVSQVLAFGLFYAHRSTASLSDDPASRAQSITDFWTTQGFLKSASKLNPFKGIIDSLAKQLTGDNSNLLKSWFGDLSLTLAHADYVGTAGTNPDYHTLFEQFLIAFDPQSRFDYGAFYTPDDLTSFVVSTTKAVVSKEFGGSLYELADTILDPCCGTGGFLDKLLDEVDSDTPPNLVGLEILPAPYALAHYRIDNKAAETKYKGSISIFLADTLSDSLEAPTTQGAGSAFSSEIQGAHDSSQTPLMLVIGNPPSSFRVRQNSPRSVINGLMDDFRPPAEGRSSRSNIQKALNNEFVRFLRWSSQKVINSGQGVVALVVPESFGRAISFAYARKWITENFQRVICLRIDGDARSGVRTNSLFHTMQGRMVLIMCKTADGNASIEGVQYHSISNLGLAEKIDWLNSGTADPSVLLDAETISITESSKWRFEDSDLPKRDLWDKFHSLNYLRDDLGHIFTNKCSGLKLGATGLIFHSDANQLRARTQQLSNTNRDKTTLWGRWFQGQQRPPSKTKLTPKLRSKFKSATANKNFSNYTFRPFTTGSFINDDGVFDELESGSTDATRSRPEVRRAFEQGAVGIALCPAPADVSENLTRIANFVWSVPDNDLSARGNAMVHCDKFPVQHGRNNWSKTVSSNVSSSVSKYFDFGGSDSSTWATYYSYAILSSGAYLSTFEQILFRSADPSDPPRIPIVDDDAVRKELAELGRLISGLENPDEGIDKPAGYKELALCVLWPDGFEEFDLSKFEVNVDAGLLILTSGSTEVKISGIPPAVLDLEISGHSVIGKWLREREHRYLRRSFNKSDLEELFELITRIDVQQYLITQVDCIVESIMNSTLDVMSA